MTNFASQISATGQGNSPSPGDEHGHSAYVPVEQPWSRLHERFGYPLPRMAGGDPEADEPAGGDGGGNNDGPFAQYLADVPDEHRPWATDFVKKVEGDTTKRFQTAAEFERTWKPYQELGVNDIEPEALNGYLDIVSKLSNPQTAADEIARIAGIHGLDLSELTGEPSEPVDPDRQQLREELRKELLGELAPQLQQVEQLSHQHRVSQIEADLKAGLDQIDADRGTKLTKAQRDHVLQLSIGFAHNGDKDPLKSAYDLWTQIAADTENGLVHRKQGEPEPHESGGRTPADAPDKPKSFEEAAALHRAELHAQARVAV